MKERLVIDLAVRTSKGQQTPQTAALIYQRAEQGIDSNRQRKLNGVKGKSVHGSTKQSG